MAASPTTSLKSLLQSPTAKLKSSSSKFPPICLRSQPSGGRVPSSRRFQAADAALSSSSSPRRGQLRVDAAVPGASAGHPHVPSPSDPSQIGPQAAVAGVHGDQFPLLAASASSGVSTVPPLPQCSPQVVASDDSAPLPRPLSPAATSEPAAVATAAGAPATAVQAKLSFARVVRSPPGPSFIRDHSSAVAAFGALPDIEAQPSISSIEGIPSVTFSPEELQAAENIFLDAIVMKFTSGRPSWEACYSSIKSWGLDQEFVMGPLDSRSVLLRFRAHRDMIAILARESHYINGFPYRIFRWNRQYNVREEAAFAPIWVSFPRLPIPFFVPSMLKGIANSIGNFLCFDRSTTLMTRASSARVCIEVDLRRKLPAFIWIGVHDKFQQPISYEQLPRFCTTCNIQGHFVEECKRKSPVFRVHDLLYGHVSDQASTLSKHIDGSNPAPDRISTISYQLQQPTAIISQASPSIPSDKLSVLPGQPEASSVPPASPTQVASRGRAPHPASKPTVSAMTSSILSAEPCAHLAPNQSFGYQDACMTDLDNQHPPHSSPNPILQVDRTRTPGVCGNADQLLYAGSDLSGHNPPAKTNLVKPSIAIHVRGDTSSVGHLSPIQPTTSIDQQQLLVHATPSAVNSLFLTSGSVMNACMIDSSNQHPQPTQLPLCSDLPLTCTPGVCHIVDMTANSHRSRPLFSHVAGYVSPIAQHYCDIVSHQQSAPHQASPSGARPCDLPIIAESSISPTIIPVQAHQSAAISGHPSSSSEPSSISRAVLPVDQCRPPSSQSLELAVALDRLKQKVNYHPHHVVDYSAHQFQVDSDDDNFNDSESQDNSDRDDGLVHPHEMGYHSADGRSSSTYKKSLAQSGHKINKRHPNVPLNAKLRSRKSSCPSSP